MAKLNMAEIVALGREHGFTDAELPDLAAVVMTESGGWTDRVQGRPGGDLRPVPGLLGRGLVQIDLGQHPSVTEAQAFDPDFAMSFARRLSRNASGLGPTNWYGPRDHPDVAARARAEARELLAQRGPTMKLVSRAEWGARSPAGRTPAPGMTRGVGVHWLGGGRGPTDHSACAGMMRWVQDFHMGPERGWADFAYNDGACCHGYVFEGRGPRIRNAANGGGIRDGLDANAAWASILYLAGSDGPELTPEGADAINDAAEHLGVAAGEWLGHGDFLSTECPGEELYSWVHLGHPRGNAAPSPAPAPTPDLEVASMFIFDGPPERGGGVYYTDGRTKWGVPNEASLVFYGTGKVPHLGVLSAEVFDALPWNIEGADQEVEVVSHGVAGTLAKAMERSGFETGDPGCSSSLRA